MYACCIGVSGIQVRTYLCVCMCVLRLVLVAAVTAAAAMDGYGI